MARGLWLSSPAQGRCWPEVPAGQAVRSALVSSCKFDGSLPAASCSISRKAPVLFARSSGLPLLCTLQPPPHWMVQQHAPLLVHVCCIGCGGVVSVVPLVRTQALDLRRSSCRAGERRANEADPEAAHCGELPAVPPAPLLPFCQPSSPPAAPAHTGAACRRASTR